VKGGETLRKMANAIDSYRMDNRTVEQFAEAIEKATKAERDIIDRYVRQFERRFGVKLTVEDNGCDNTGKLLNYRKVNTKADFLLNGVPYEVKFNNDLMSIFRFKAEQLESYLKQGATVLWINGYHTQTPMYTIIEREDLERIKLECAIIPFIPWGGKRCYELYADDFDWTSLEGKGDGKSSEL
jgi:hypothetical protein